MSQNLSTETKVRDALEVTREKQVMIRLSAEQHAAWSAAAAAAKRTLADWVRIVVDERLEQAKPKKGRR